MKGFGIQLIDHTEEGITFDVKITILRDETGKIRSGLTLGDTLEQNQAILLLQREGDLKSEPTLGVAFNDLLLGDDLLLFRHKIRREFSKDGLTITDLNLYNKEKLTIKASY
jgi:hypothetical protein